ncbi:MAG: PKD domain-containing protein, partial [Gammaproteobacteria bacterium]|nr:PKD domain-containing protein [Gammaproteobacteria bacterium]
GAIATHDYSSIGTYTTIVTATNSLSQLTETTIVTITDTPISGLAVNNSSPTELGNATIFMATISSGTNVIYTWDFGDGTTGNGAIATHDYSSIGTYTTIVTATNSLSQLTETTIATITDTPISGLAVNNSSPTELGNATTFTATISSGTNVIYAWDFGDGTTTAGSLVRHTYDELGTYTVTVHATNSNSAISRIIIVKIRIYLYLPTIIRE